MSSAPTWALEQCRFWSGVCTTCTKKLILPSIPGFHIWNHFGIPVCAGWMYVERWRVTCKETWLTLLSVDVFPSHSLSLSICRWEITVPILQRCFGNELICIECFEDKKSYSAFGLDNKNLWKQWWLHRGILFLSNVGLWDCWYLYAVRLCQF